MQFEIYNALVIAEDDDIDEPITEIVVTEERNLFAVWENVKDNSPKLVKWFRDYERGMAIEFAVDLGRSMRSKLAKAKSE